jgi:hypothetical protein
MNARRSPDRVAAAEAPAALPRWPLDRPWLAPWLAHWPFPRPSPWPAGHPAPVQA